MNRVEKRIMNEWKEQRNSFDEYGFYGENNAPLPPMKEESFRDEIPSLMGKVYGGSEELRDKVDFHGKFEDMPDDVQDQIINPKHYKMIPPEAYEKFPNGLEYMDLMEYILAHHKGVEAHLLGQIFKYACRLGKKDADLQDARKIQWYANRLVNVIEERS